MICPRCSWITFTIAVGETAILTIWWFGIFWIGGRL